MGMPPPITPSQIDACLVRIMKARLRSSFVDLCNEAIQQVRGLSLGMLRPDISMHATSLLACDKVEQGEMVF